MRSKGAHAPDRGGAGTPGFAPARTVDNDDIARDDQVVTPSLTLQAPPPDPLRRAARSRSGGTIAAVTVRVVVAEDSLLVREGICRLLELSEGVEVAASVEDLPGLLAAVDEHRPDVLLTDIRMPPTGTDEGIRAALQLRRDHPGIGVVVLSQFVEPTYALQLLEDGSEGRAYLLKERVGDPDQLVAAIRQVAHGGSMIDPKVVESLVASRSRRPASPLERLSPREREVLAEIAQGHNNAAVAARLVLSPRAVEKHINSLFSKLGLSEEPEVHRRVKAVLLYLADASDEPTGSTP